MALVKEPRFVNPEDVQRRLDQVVVRYKSKPVYAQYNGKKSVLLIDMLEAKSDGGSSAYVEADAEDEDLDLSIPPLGYVNFVSTKWGGMFPLYFMRSTPRVTKAGIELRNIQFLGKNNEFQKGWGGSVTPILKPLGEAIAGKYPTFDEARARATTEGGMAFDRRIAFGNIKSIPVVLYRGRPAGLYDAEKNSVWLGRDYIKSPAEAVLGKFMKVQYGKETAHV